MLSAPQVSLLSLFVVVFAVPWDWLGSDEAPSAAVLAGGILVLGAQAANEALSPRSVERATARRRLRLQGRYGLDAPTGAIKGDVLDQAA